ncbi:hypothetical protein OAK81_01980 [Verrucomicrobiales bacterium]|nr:hypothetical protein [Verrucomicrobiales bacterium]
MTAVVATSARGNSRHTLIFSAALSRASTFGRSGFGAADFFSSNKKFSQRFDLNSLSALVFVNQRMSERTSINFPAPNKSNPIAPHWIGIGNSSPLIKVTKAMIPRMIPATISKTLVTDFLWISFESNRIRGSIFSAKN